MTVYFPLVVSATEPTTLGEPIAVTIAERAETELPTEPDNSNDVGNSNTHIVKSHKRK